MLAGRPHEAVGNVSPRWMIAARANARRTEPGLQAGSPPIQLPDLLGPDCFRPKTVQALRIKTLRSVSPPCSDVPVIPKSAGPATESQYRLSRPDHSHLPVQSGLSAKNPSRPFIVR
jgi:hypothetical protein